MYKIQGICSIAIFFDLEFKVTYDYGAEYHVGTSMVVSLSHALLIPSLPNSDTGDDFQVVHS